MSEVIVTSVKGISVRTGKSSVQSKKFPGRELCYIQFKPREAWIVEKGVLSYLEEIGVNTEAEINFWPQISWVRIQFTGNLDMFNNSSTWQSKLDLADELRLEPPKYMNVVAELRKQQKLERSESWGWLKRSIYRALW